MLKWSDLRLVKVVFWREISGIHFMHIAIVCILALLVFIPGIIRIKKKKSTIVDVILSYLLCVCVGIVLLITIFRREAGYPRNIISPFPTWENYGGNWFKTIFSFFNIILFVPFGLLVRLKQYRVPEKKAFIFTALMGILFTLFIENTQLITQTGYFEFTDMLNNFIGGMLGAKLGAIVLICHDALFKADKCRL
ncbi:MAG: VanZ family protein [Butyrivibrio sp.]|nr:VanZ family protein [Butyrivibrio sp.]